MAQRQQQQAAHLLLAQEKENGGIPMAPEYSPVKIRLRGRTFYYREVAHPLVLAAAASGGQASSFGYKLEAIAPLDVELDYSQQDLWSMQQQEMSQLKLFDHVAVCEANTAMLQFVFASLKDGAYRCRVTPSCHLSPYEYTASPPPPAQGGERVPGGGDADEYVSMPIYTTMHDFLQMRVFNDRYFYQGCSMVPSNKLFVPVWMNNDRMAHLMGQLRRKSIPKAAYDATMVVLGADRASSWVRYRKQPSSASSPAPPPVMLFFTAAIYVYPL